MRTLALTTTLASALYAQNQRQATIVGGGNPERGKCTVEVVVDDGAQVEIRGTTATLRALSGRPPQWRRFECTGAMPVNPGNIRFSGVDGRGRQELVRDPRNGGAVVVQIEDRDSGTEGYTFDIEWDARGPYAGGNVGGPFPGGNPGNHGDGGRGRYDDQYRPGYRDSDYYRRYNHGFGTDEAVRVCQEAVMNQASRRFHTKDIHFQRTAIDDSPGRNDWVTGSVDVHRGRREERYGFSCAVDFNTGRVRSAELSARPLADDPRRH